MEFLPFALPEIGEEEINEVVECLRSGWITTGSRAKQFEQEFADYLGNNVQALAVNSATSGLHLALEALGVREGDEVILPSYTFTSTAEVVRYLGATPVIVDVDESTFNISVEAIKAAITPNTKAVMPVHFAGLACDMEAIIQLAREHNLFVVEDAAHAFPSTSGGSLVGALGTDATVFSFYANKTMTTAEGGMLVSKRSDVIERAKIMRLHGISRDAFDRYRSEAPSWFYEVVEPGYKYNMPDVCAAIGIHQLRKIDRFQKKRQELAVRYDSLLKSFPVVIPPKAVPGDKHAYHLYPIRIKEEAGISRDEFIQEMSKQKIGCSVHFIPLHRQPVWRDGYKLTREDFSVAERLFNSEVSIPLYTKMRETDQLRVVDAMKKVFGC
ncbi:DegT/DnrJ/EryC1/StrS family aminotransferase [Halodesulfovibrio aestuarii]|uniref:dTDP-4-amino-4,6-dideoxygalactose transaminase n=1 Tax=Halodesulfovibrio aestuarii TaxID=126333 RepID=A0A8G2FBI3_9BACT|nr:DegT/DnrJ/EryC1/StrS family aminotransferase [Halodesulfovibrio aestuarii]SHJ29006.1 dTDP-4-amino-4,6-dideoxygalactose transaminase [Halodesulfovibrio aestuarii]